LAKIVIPQKFWKRFHEIYSTPPLWKKKNNKNHVESYRTFVLEISLRHHLHAIHISHLSTLYYLLQNFLKKEPQRERGSINRAQVIQEEASRKEDNDCPSSSQRYNEGELDHHDFRGIQQPIRNTILISTLHRDTSSASEI
jgi:hypothetical protein